MRQCVLCKCEGIDLGLVAEERSSFPASLLELQNEAAALRVAGFKAGLSANDPLRAHAFAIGRENEVGCRGGEL